MSGSMHASMKHSFLRDIIEIMERSAAFVSTYVIDTRSSLTSFVTCNSLRSADLAVIKGVRFLTALYFSCQKTYALIFIRMNRAVLI